MPGREGVHGSLQQMTGMPIVRLPDEFAKLFFGKQNNISTMQFLQSLVL
jgi:hypothetical protein